MIAAVQWTFGTARDTPTHSHAMRSGAVRDTGLRDRANLRRIPTEPYVLSPVNEVWRTLAPFSRTMSILNGRVEPRHCLTQQPDVSAANMMSCRA